MLVALPNGEYIEAKDILGLKKVNGSKYDFMIIMSQVWIGIVGDHILITCKDDAERVKLMANLYENINCQLEYEWKWHNYDNH